MNGSLEIFKVLYSDATVKSLTASKIAAGRVEPESWLVSDTTCLIYQNSPVDEAQEYFSGRYTVNCRAKIEEDAEELQIAVSRALNRRSSSGTFFTTQYEPVIQPFDSTDNYNIPVSVLVRSRN